MSSRIKIYRCVDPNCAWINQPYSYACQHGFDISYYEPVYTCSGLSLRDAIRVSEGNLPNDFYGFPYSTSDLIDDNGTLYYADPAWFVEISNTLQ